jgi:hypothetical protein
MTSDYLDIDLRDKRPRFTRPRRHLTAEDREVLGPLARAETASDDAADVLEGIYQCIRTEMQGDLTSSNPVVRSRALSAMRGAYQNLVGSEYKEFVPLLSELQIRLSKIAQVARRVLVRRLLSSTTSDQGRTDHTVSRRVDRSRGLAGLEAGICGSS